MPEVFWLQTQGPQCFLKLVDRLEKDPGCAGNTYSRVRGAHGITNMAGDTARIVMVGGHKLEAIFNQMVHHPLVAQILLPVGLPSRPLGTIDWSQVVGAIAAVRVCQPGWRHVGVFVPDLAAQGPELCDARATMREPDELAFDAPKSELL